MFANGFVAALLRSPLHGLISGAVMLVSVKGRRSGRLVSTPVNYVRDGKTLLAVSLPGPTAGTPDVDLIRAVGPKRIVVRFDPTAGEIL